ncbi:hypothetical protein G6F43_003876 [Rhizopus delemar]|nr:hypothetical protein G6F43_003876 [Rhizopus delemar]
MHWSQVVAKKRTLLMIATFEYDIHNSQQDKIIHSKMWRAERSPAYGLNCETISITSRNRKIAEINFDPLDPALDRILKDGITFENDAARLLPCRAFDPAVPLVRL